ncbi:MAG: response regulator transcription factor [Lentisphaerae bacterium]|nr:response regulator transcription factor [Lentisphaerota bacterium]
MPKKILVVDDDSSLVFTMQQILEKNGYEVRTAADTAQAQQVLDQGFQPDGMILDVLMHGKAEGIIFARQLRKDPAHKNIPILMLTCMSDVTGYRPIKDDPRDPVFLPVEMYLEKPVAPAKLLKKVEELLATATA